MPESSRQHFTVAVLLIASVSLATAVVERLGWLEHFETAGLDAFSVMQTRPAPKDIVIVAVTEDDYVNPDRFGATSPLRCETVQALIETVAAAHPLVIGVDLDTGDPRFACLRALVAHPPIVIWAADATWNGSTLVFTVEPPLAGRGVLSSDDLAGVAVVPQDRDGVVRQYERTVPIADGQRADTFPWALLKAACRAGNDKSCRATTQVAADAGPLRLNFSGDRFTFATFPAGALLSVAGQSAWQRGGVLDGMIVLIGGMYREARDVQFTPVGPKAGVEILAQAVASELEDRGIRPINVALATALDIVVGLVLVFINYRLRARFGLALVVSLLVIPLFCLVSSFVAFSTLAFWFNFTPVVVSVMMHQLFEHGREYQRLRALHGSAH